MHDGRGVQSTWGTGMSKAHVLGTVVKGVVSRFQMEGGHAVLSQEHLVLSSKELQAVPAQQREQVLTELVAVACGFQRLGGAKAAKAVGQLLVLASGLMADMEAVKALFVARGVELKNASRFIGGAVSIRPVAGGPSAAATLCCHRLTWDRLHHD